MADQPGAAPDGAGLPRRCRHRPRGAARTRTWTGATAPACEFALDNVVAALAPSNNPLVSPAAWKAFIDTGGGSAVAGLRNLIGDLAAAPRVPTMVRPDAFEVGRDLAVTPGAVVLRTEVLELIQYAPQTPTVRTRPLLMVPPVINKFYIADLAPGRSLVEYLVQGGQQVFMISWRNPDVRHRDWDVDTYGQAILDAVDAALAITGADSAVVQGFCSGGTLESMLLGALQQRGQLAERVAAFGLAVCVLDQAQAGVAGALLDERTARTAAAVSRTRGYLDGRRLAEVFAWLRPDDLIWSYWVNNYLQGREPAPFDILYWNADTTRMTAGLHRDFLDLGLRNSLVHPGEARMLGAPVDLSSVAVDGYVVAGVADHISPWQNCYRSAQLFGGRTRFVLSTSGHIAAIVNPPTNRKASYQVAAGPAGRGGRVGSGPPRRPAGRGGRTSSPGWRSAAGPSGPRPPSSAVARIRSRWPRLPAPTSWIDDRDPPPRRSARSRSVGSRCGSPCGPATRAAHRCCC